MPLDNNFRLRVKVVQEVFRDKDVSPPYTRVGFIGVGKGFKTGSEQVPVDWTCPLSFSLLGEEDVG